MMNVIPLETIREYTRIEDPGHSWLMVPTKDFAEAGIYKSITPYSPYKRGIHYLEEDCDMWVFVDAMKAKGIRVKTNRLEVDDFDKYFSEGL